jgi:hypothetical protein
MAGLATTTRGGSRTVFMMLSDSANLRPNDANRATY